MSAEENQWQSVCDLEDIPPDSGVCALYHNRQVAIFRPRGQERLFALSNFDPIGGANVLSRGILGSAGDKLVVASPLYKQHFDLQTGHCLEHEQVAVDTFSVRVHGGQVQLAAGENAES